MKAHLFAVDNAWDFESVLGRVLIQSLLQCLSRWCSGFVVFLDMTVSAGSWMKGNCTHVGLVVDGRDLE